MGLFGSKKRNKFNPEQVDIPEIEYKNLQQAMIEAVSLGSKDVKIVTVKLKDGRTIDFTVSSGLIKHATDGTEKKTISRLQWAEQERFSAEDREKIQEIVETTPFFTAIARISDEVSLDAARYVGEAFKNNTINLMESCLYETIVKTETDWMLSDESKLVEAYDVFALDITKIDEFLAERFELQNKTNIFLDGNDYNEVVLGATETTDYFSASSDEERFVVVAATNGSNLEELYENSSGFDWIKVVKSVETLMWKSLVKVEMPSTDEDLPEFELSQDDFNKFLNGEEYTDQDSENSDVFTEDIADDDGWRFAAPSDDVNDDGGFDYEVVEDETEGFTQGLEEELRLAVTQILDESDVSDEETTTIINLVDYNEDLETSVKDIESQISYARADYNATFGEYQGLAIQTVVDQMSDEEETTDKGEIENVRDESNESFFSLEKLESDRATLNETRRDILTELLGKISGLSSLRVQEVVHRIENKLRGIDLVTNVAFYDKKDDENERHKVDSVLLDDRLLRKYDKRDTPVFFTIVKRFGYNPFE